MNISVCTKLYSDTSMVLLYKQTLINEMIMSHECIIYQESFN